MATFAELDENNIVISCVKVRNEDIGNLEFPESEPVGLEYLYQTFGVHRKYLQTSISGAFRNTFGRVGYKYYPEYDVFIEPKPPVFPSFVLDTEKFKWVPPVPRPDDGKPYVWDESSISWKSIE
jgi:hypothetical protein